MNSPNPTATLTVAVVGSSPLLREALAALLRAAPGFNVVAVKGDPGGVARLVSPPSVILWEAASGGDALSLTRELRAACPPSTAILLLGPPVDGAALADIVRAGATGYVASDSTPADLFSLLRQAARGEPALSPRLAVALLTQLTAAAPPSESLAAPPLSEREMEVLRLAASGATNKQIAQQLYLSVRTVEGHLARLYAKLGVNSRTEAALVAIRRGWAPA